MAPPTRAKAARPTKASANRKPDTETATRPKRVRLSAEARREQLLDCAADLLVEGGSEALTMEGLAARAGVNKALPYYHFKTREAVLLDLYEREFAALSARVGEAVEAAPDFPSKIRALLGVWLDDVDRPDVLGAIATVRTESDTLEQARRAHDVETTLWVADMMTAEYGLAPNVALIAAATMLSSSIGFLHAWSSTRMSRSDAVELFLSMTMAAADAATGFTRAKGPRRQRTKRAS